MAKRRYFWLKLKENWFKDKRIKKLRSIAGGDTYTVIYLKMQLLSLKNEGYLYFEGVDEDFITELALDLDEEVENVKVTVSFLQKNGLLEMTDDDEYLLTDVPNAIGSEGDSAHRMRSLRQNRKELASLCDNNVQKSDREIEIEKELDIEKEIEKDTELEKEQEIEENTDGKRQRIDYQAIIDLYNSICISFPKVTKLTDPRKRAIKTMLNKVSIDEMRTAFEKAEASDFMKSGTWASFDWMMKESHFIKIIEGNYDNKQSSQPRTAEQERISNRISEVDGWRV